jgi:very-long-chain ceramide synthase
VTALKIVTVPIVLYLNWEFASKYVTLPFSNPFGPLFLLSGYVEGSAPDDPRYAKTWFDIPFLVYYVVFFSMVRQFITVDVAVPVARYFGLKKASKIVRFGEQTYALIYFSFFGAWGYVRSAFLPFLLLTYPS